MLAPAFAVAPPPSLVPRRHISPPRRRRAHCCTPSPPQPATLESTFRSLGADAAADLAYVTHSHQPPPPAWETILNLFERHEITGEALSRLATRLSLTSLLRLDPHTVSSVLQFLSTDVHLSPQQRARAVAQRPDLLRSLAPLSAARDALLDAGLQPRDLCQVVPRWPGLLVLDASRITRATTFLSSPAVGLSRNHLRALLRRAPWVLIYDPERDVTPAVACLRDALSIEHDVSLHHFFLASPVLLGSSRDTILPVLDFLQHTVGLDTCSLRAAVRSFPPILTCSVHSTLEPAARFLRLEVGLGQKQLSRAVRAFPAVLTLDVEKDMRAVVNYFRGRAVVNIARIVSRLPPILGYDLETNIIPKMDYVEQYLGLSSYDVLSFPGYFSYSLERCIEPRTKFLQAKGHSITQSGLNLTLSLTDEDYCARIARAPLSQYYTFRKAYRRRRRKDVRRTTAAKTLIDIDNSPGEPGSGTAFAHNVAPSSSWENPGPREKRRKRRFRATLSRMPWNELK